MLDYSVIRPTEMPGTLLVGGGAELYQLRIEDGCLHFGGRKSAANRVKFYNVTPLAPAGSLFLCRATLRTDRPDARLRLGACELAALSAQIVSEPFEVGTSWRECEFTFRTFSSGERAISVEDASGDVVAENIYIRSVAVELIEKAEEKPTKPDERTTLILIGDSIVNDYSTTTMKKVGDRVVRETVTKGLTRGWGMYIGEEFDAARLRVVNRGRCGFSTRSFCETDGRALYNDILANTHPGDYWMVSLGINDQYSSLVERHTTTQEYAGFLHQFVRDAEKHGAKVIFVTPTVMMNTEPFRNTTRERAEIMTAVAQEENCMLLDVNAAMEKFIRGKLDTVGREEVLATYYSATEDKKTGKVIPDTTHQREAGSRLVVSFIREALALSDSPLAGLLV